MIRLPAIRRAVCLASFASLGTSAFANSIEKLEVSALEGFEEAPVIRVYSTDGESWNRVDATATARFKVRLKAECRYEGRGNKAYEGDLIVPGFEIIGDTDPPDFLIPDSSTAEGTFRFAGGAGQPTNPVEVCGVELTKRLSQNEDLTKYHVLAQGLTVDYPGAFEVKYRLYCNPTGLGKFDLGSDTALVNARVQCAASDLAEANIPKPEPAKLVAAKLIPLVKETKFEAEPAEHMGKCPVGVRFNGTITVTQPGEVRYRYVSHDNLLSPEFTLEFDAAGTKATRLWSRTFSEPEPDSQLAAVPGGKTWDYQGWYRLDILAPDPKQSSRAEFRISCKEPVPARLIRPRD